MDGGGEQLVFAYGTLRLGQHNHSRLHGSRFLGVCLSPHAFTLLRVGNFPAAVEAGTQSITGEVYAVGGHRLSALDELEGYPNFFDRAIIDTRFGPSWMYVYQRATGHEPRILSGDWLYR